MRLNLFQNIPLFHRMSNNQLFARGSLLLDAQIIPGSLSFNNVIILVSRGDNNATRSGSYSFSFGLYSLNNGTLSLANSAEATFESNASFFSNYTLATSTTQDITPGNWFFGFGYSSTANNGAASIIFAGNEPTGGTVFDDGAHGGPFFRGHYTVALTGLPVSIETSALNKEGISNNPNQVCRPYILISA